MVREGDSRCFREAMPHFTRMARRRSRRIQPLLPGFGLVVALLLLVGSILGLVWMAGQSLVVKAPEKVPEKTPPPAMTARR